MGTVKDLREFLIEAELDHYYSALKNELKIASIPQIKYVEIDDLVNIGMTKPEMRRLKKHFKREFPQGALGKLKKAILDRTHSESRGRPLSPPGADHRLSRPLSHPRPPGKQIIPADSIAVNKTLGEGEFGIVQQGIWTTEEGQKVQVAIKCLSSERMQNGTPEFLKEAGIMQTIDHDNIVRLFGVVLDKDNSLMLVTELAPMRSLLECLKEPSLRLDFPLPRLCDFAQQICDGMSYLESKRLIHRDLAARNILVFTKNKVKVSDFGLSRALGFGKDYYQSNFSINLKLPIAWCAPECINYLKFTSASDVWAYGVTLWEMFTYGFQPWAGMTGQQILEAIDIPICQHLDQPDLCPKEYYQLMKRCWEHDPKGRPTFSEMFIRLPQLRPVQVKAVKDFPEITVPKDYLYYKSYDVIIVLDKSPTRPPARGLWKGVLFNGRAGYFDPTHTVPFLEPKTSPISLPKPNIVRRESSRKSNRKIKMDMIGRPQNDLRHTGHIGYDGAIFGDVSFIGDNYDKLPVKVGSTSGKDDLGSSGSLSRCSDSPDRDFDINNRSRISLDEASGTNGLNHSWMSRESLESTSTWQTESDRDGTKTPPYTDIEDDSLFSDFKMPDISSSMDFDFGPSFMDEVLRALYEKEAKMESASQSSSPTKQNHVGPDSSPLSSSPRNSDSKPGPPPLPSQPPRMDVRKDPRFEPKKQAKVKPMSASEERIMDSAFALANECAILSTRGQMFSEPHSPTTVSPRRSDSDSGSESPTLMSKLKSSIKRSPKQERKRTFSEEISTKSDLDEDVPPEAQEAYNELVVRGSIKHEQWSSVQDREQEREAEREREREREQERQRELDRERQKQMEVQRDQERERQREIEWEREKQRERELELELLRGRKQKPAVQQSISVEKDSVTMVTNKNLSLSVSKPETPPKPLPKPRIDGKKSEIPIPSPRGRPEIHRVEPVIRSVPESERRSESVSSTESDSKPLIIKTDVCKEEDNLQYEDDEVNHIKILRVDLPDSEFKGHSADRDSDDVPKIDSQSEGAPKYSFEEEFSEPSPREIMNKLARESRIRRSLDHQRGITGEGSEVPANRNLREPQGIPGKGVSASTNGDEEDEVDTNPLRMLRGGAIPIRTSRLGQGRRIVRK